MTTVKRARLTQLGWDTDLTFESQATATDPGPGQIRVAVEACGVCYRDCVDRQGGFKFLQLPITPGHELVGRVIACGPGVRDFALGDRVASMHRDFCGVCSACRRGEPSFCAAGVAVLGLVLDGGYASEVVAPERCFYRAPADLEAAAAAVLHCTFGTAYRGLLRFGRLQAGERVLVSGANGGVGHAAVQLASRLGAEVVAVVREDRHAGWLEGLGAAQVLVDPGDGFHKRLRAPVDLAIDCVGAPTFNASLRSLRPGGRAIAVGNVNEERVGLNLGLMITKGLKIVGSAGADRSDMAELLELLAERPFDVHIEERLPLREADRAQRRLRQGGSRGRLVLFPDG
jgi:D-arabinose 1-dehydrogenase-like Zn-dependent alcohol dehydrogenase